MWADLRFTLRGLARNPGFTLVAILTVALGIGANTAMFSVVNGVLLKPLPYRDADRLMRLQEGRPGFTLNISYPNFLDWRARNNVFEEMAIYNPVSSTTLTGRGDAEVLPSAWTEPHLFDFLGLAPSLGRTFRSGEDNVVVLSDRLWRTRFNADPALLGQSLTLSSQPYTVIGILPPDMRLSNRDVWFPMLPEKFSPPQKNRGNHPGFQALARLKPGVTVDQARRGMTAIAKDLERQYPSTNFQMGVMIMPMLDATVGNVRPMLRLLTGAVGFVLLIACANVANVLLARGLGRQSEIAVRASLGAGRGRLFRLFLSESIVLAVAGSVLGVLLASWTLDAIKITGARFLPRAAGIQLDSTVLAFTAAIAMLSAVLFGIAPAWQASRVNLLDALKQGGRGGTDSSHRLRWTLIATEVALSVVLLIGAGLMIRTLAGLSQVDPGYRAQNLITFNLHPPGSHFTNAESLRSFAANVVTRVRSIPGVESAATCWPFDLTTFSLTPYLRLADKPVAAGQEPAVVSAYVSPDYFATMGIPMKAGRAFTPADRSGAPTVVVVSDEFVRVHFRNENPIGKRVSLVGYDFLGSMEIVGVVGNTLRGGLASGTVPELYGSELQLPQGHNSLLVRTAGDPSAAINAIRKEISSIDSEIAVNGITRIEEALWNTVSNRSFTRYQLLVFAGLALLLATIGIYGVVSYSTLQRTREFGVRMALGAESNDVIGLVLRRTAFPVAVGVAAGVGAAALLTRQLENQLYGVKSFDPLTVAAVVTVLAAAAVAACVIPARRAARLDPLAALRAE